MLECSLDKNFGVSRDKIPVIYETRIFGHGVALPPDKDVDRGIWISFLLAVDLHVKCSRDLPASVATVSADLEVDALGVPPGREVFPCPVGEFDTSTPCRALPV